MNRIQGEVLRHVVFGTMVTSGEALAHPCLPWLERQGYITEASWDAEVTPEGYVAAIREGLLTIWYRLVVNGGGIAMELNTYGRGSQNSTYEARQALEAELRRGLTAGAYRLVADDAGHYRVEAR